MSESTDWIEEFMDRIFPGQDYTDCRKIFTEEELEDMFDLCWNWEIGYKRYIRLVVLAQMRKDRAKFPTLRELDEMSDS